MRPTRALLDALDQARQRGLIQGDYGKPAVELVTEKEFQAAVEALAKRNGWLCYHTRDSRRSVAGFPDCVCLKPGRLVVAELKVPPNKLTAAQTNWLEAWRAIPAAEVHVWYPSDWVVIEDALR